MIWGWIWVGVIVLAIILELTTDQMISIWFVPGAIVATILDFFGVHYIWQILVVLLVAVLGIVFLRKYIAKRGDDASTKTNMDVIVGEKCIVLERVDTFAGRGQVKVKGQVWSARGIAEDDVFDVGEVLLVIGVEGVKLICRRP